MCQVGCQTIMTHSHHTTALSIIQNKLQQAIRYLYTTNTINNERLLHATNTTVQQTVL